MNKRKNGEINPFIPKNLLFSFLMCELFGHFCTFNSKNAHIPVINPQILTKVNKYRNLLEHEYKIPTDININDLISVVELFISATDRFVVKKETRFTIRKENNLRDIRIKYDESNRTFSIEFFIAEERRVTPRHIIQIKGKSYLFKIDKNDPYFIHILKKYIELIEIHH